MKLIIAGSRHISPSRVYYIIDDFLYGEQSRLIFHPISEIVTGGATGVDTAGEAWASIHEIPLRVFYPDWDIHGKAAGPLRNREMAEYADYLLLIWDGRSRGSSSMKREMEKLGKPIYEIIVELEE